VPSLWDGGRLGDTGSDRIGPAWGYLLDERRVADDIESLVAAHRQGVHRYLCRIVGSADKAHDLTQEVFLRVSRASVPETNDTGQRAWIFRIARNLALNHLRDGRRRPEPVALVERGTAATQELQLAVRQALAALPAVDRDVFLLRESVGLSYDEIAEACDLSANAVGSRLHRVRLALREALGGHVDDRRSGGVRWTS
jgi:RNA polymerase sigma factor (sigma-70 family)